MPRPCKHCICQAFNGDRIFKPRSIPMSQLQTIVLDETELEAMRLCDLEGLTQEEAGDRMGVSRGTVQRLVSRGRLKVTQALLESSALVIEAKRQ